VSVGAEDQRGVCVVEQRPHRFARGRQLRAGLQRTPDTHGRGAERGRGCRPSRLLRERAGNGGWKSGSKKPAAAQTTSVTHGLRLVELGNVVNPYSNTMKYRRYRYAFVIRLTSTRHDVLKVRMSDPFWA